jgi:hypothetical protein
MPSLPSEFPTRISYAEADQGTLLGLYHGYDEARLALAKLVSRFGTRATREESTQQRIWSRTHRQGLAREIFDPPVKLPAADGINRGAHSAALAAFATMSEQAEELLRALRARWPELSEDAGGPLPAPSQDWDWN